MLGGEHLREQIDPVLFARKEGREVSSQPAGLNGSLPTTSSLLYTAGLRHHAWSGATHVRGLPFLEVV